MFFYEEIDNSHRVKSRVCQLSIVYICFSYEFTTLELCLNEIMLILMDIILKFWFWFSKNKNNFYTEHNLLNMILQKNAFIIYEETALEHIRGAGMLPPKD